MRLRVTKTLLTADDKPLLGFLTTRKSVLAATKQYIHLGVTETLVLPPGELHHARPQ